MNGLSVYGIPTTPPLNYFNEGLIAINMAFAWALADYFKAFEYFSFSKLINRYKSTSNANK